MLFNSSEFLVFFLLVFVAFFMAPRRWKMIVLLVASYIFYGAWKPSYLLILFGSTSLDFLLAKHVISSPNRKNQKLGLALSLIINLGVLVSFKYLDFFGEILHEMFSPTKSFEPFAIMLPIGISFYTFQTIAYSIDVYKKTIPPENNFIKFALFTSFFPQLVAGPIERASNLLPQFSIEKIGVKKENLVFAVWYLTVGLFMKSVLADNSGIVVDSIFENVSTTDPEKLAYASWLFTLQIYGDFAGYSLMAIGLARLFNIRLTENFSYPFFAQSMTIFWRSWHKTLSFWFRDYLYIPLGGNKSGKYRTYFNLLLVFVLVGLWHGAAWNFILWGLLNGLVLVLERVLGLREASPGVIGKMRTVLTFGLTVLFFVSFRLNSLSEILTVWKSVFTLNLEKMLILLFDNRFSIPLLSGSLLLILELYLFPRPVSKLASNHWLIQSGVFCIVALSIILMGNFSGSPFIYFQF